MTHANHEAGTPQGHGPDSVPTIVAVASRLFAVPPEAGTPRPFQLLGQLALRTRLIGVLVTAEPEGRARSFVERPEIGGLLDRSFVFERRGRFTPLAQARTLLTGGPPFDLRYKDPGALRSVHELMNELMAANGPVAFYCLGMISLQWVPEASRAGAQPMCQATSARWPASPASAQTTDVAMWRWGSLSCGFSMSYQLSRYSAVQASGRSR